MPEQMWQLEIPRFEENAIKRAGVHNQSDRENTRYSGIEGDTTNPMKSIAERVDDVYLPYDVIYIILSYIDATRYMTMRLISRAICVHINTLIAAARQRRLPIMSPYQDEIIFNIINAGLDDAYVIPRHSGRILCVLESIRREPRLYLSTNPSMLKRYTTEIKRFYGCNIVAGALSVGVICMYPVSIHQCDGISDHRTYDNGVVFIVYRDGKFIYVRTPLDAFDVRYPGTPYAAIVSNNVINVKESMWRPDVTINSVVLLDMDHRNTMHIHSVVDQIVERDISTRGSDTYPSICTPNILLVTSNEYSRCTDDRRVERSSFPNIRPRPYIDTVIMICPSGALGGSMREMVNSVACITSLYDNITVWVIESDYIGVIKHKAMMSVMYRDLPMMRTPFNASYEIDGMSHDDIISMDFDRAHYLTRPNPSDTSKIIRMMIDKARGVCVGGLLLGPISNIEDIDDLLSPERVERDVSDLDAYMLLSEVRNDHDRRMQERYLDPYSDVLTMFKWKMNHIEWTDNGRRT